MNSSPSPISVSTSFRWIALIIGIVAGAVGVLGLFTSGAEQFFQSYLVAFLFWLGLSLGSLALVMLYFVAGGKWARIIQGITSAGARTIWLLLLLFIPLLFGLSYLFPWAMPSMVAGNEVLQHQSIYMNLPLFIGRAVLYFAIWIGLAFAITRLTARSDATTNPSLFYRLRTLSTIGIILYFLTMSFAAVDWILSVQEGWYSSIFGLIILLSQGLTSLAFAILVLRIVLRKQNIAQAAPSTSPQTNRDLGAVMLALTMGWAYMSFFQYLIIWAGNISQEVTWYFIRLNNGWQVVALLIVIAQFALPFFALLSMQTRSRLSILAVISVLVFLVNLVTLYWQVTPAFYPGGFHIHWLDIVLPIAIGGLWLFAFGSQLKGRPVLPLLENPTSNESFQEVHR